MSVDTSPSLQTAEKQVRRSVVSRLLNPEALLARFSRVTSSGKVIPELEGVRTYGIFMVLLFHLMINLSIKAPAHYPVPGENYYWFMQFLQISLHAVELFFAISGFILACPFIAYHRMGARPVNMKSYYVRRLTRIEPPYFVCMILLFGVMLMTNRGTFSELLPHLGASIGYMHNLIYSEKSVLNVVAWSLEVEVQFYLLVPFLAVIFRIRNRIWRRGLIVALAVATNTYSWLFIAPGDRMYLSIIRFMHFFLIGFLLADVYMTDWKTELNRHWKWDLVTFLGWPALVVVWNMPELSYAVSTAGYMPVLDAYGYPLFMFLFYYCGVLRGVATSKLLSNIWITTIGGMSYTLYLFHNKIIGFMIEFTGRFALTGHYMIDLLLQLLMAIPVVLIFSAVFFLLIERPCMRKDWTQRAWQRIRSTMAPASRRGWMSPRSYPLNRSLNVYSYGGERMSNLVNATVSEVRKFGVMFAVIHLAIAGYSFYRGGDLWMWFLGGSAFFLLTGLFAYPVLKPIYTGWMMFAHALAWFNTRLIMGISFYLMFTPIGFVMRVLGKDPLGIRLDRQAPSYWTRRSAVALEPKRYEQLF